MNESPEDNTKLFKGKSKLTNSNNKFNENVEILSLSNIIKTKKEKEMNKEIKNSLNYIQKHIANNNYYQSMKTFYDTITPSKGKTKLFEFKNEYLLDQFDVHSNTNVSLTCICQNCIFCRNKRSIESPRSKDHFKIDYTNWRFY
ncbi:hypothetical protein H8356DRAFT_1666071 [Neocallimastix lanati (nom. inval.)]|nr:hypothetical protein H8356DRAFT_1666071 [Neocallimastix sp. JGI-2020a]